MKSASSSIDLGNCHTIIKWMRTSSVVLPAGDSNRNWEGEARAIILYPQDKVRPIIKGETKGTKALIQIMYRKLKLITTIGQPNIILLAHVSVWTSKAPKPWAPPFKQNHLLSNLISHSSRMTIKKRKKIHIIFLNRRLYSKSHYKSLKSQLNKWRCLKLSLFWNIRVML